MTRTLYVVDEEKGMIGCDFLTVGNLLGQRLSQWQMHIEELVYYVLPRFGCLLLEDTDIIT